ncbi:Hypothetical protein R9X50_00294800 [Acrodontium crateriforme]|uniref:Uncharacterized protein n=1 Tax=Acrodontium crateriforme TaxID=150365 RepID=A0AAQ3M3H2_9PEZI|nr:Hypothetical protein R9X50_00294800 [Acrodontium crateriforme]
MFSLNCTLPSEVVAIVGSPNARGTWNIVWSCSSIILLCTWSVLHLNVPEQSTPRNAKDRLKRDSIRLLWSGIWMAINILAPEWAFGKAWADYFAVREINPLFDEFKEADGVAWSTKHTFLANMGGISINFGDTTPFDNTISTGLPDNIFALHSLNHSNTVSATRNAASISSTPRQQIEPATWKGIAPTENRLFQPPNINPHIPEVVRRRLALETNLCQIYRGVIRTTAGQIQWHEDKTNAENVTRAMVGLQLNDFTTPTERDLFLRKHITWWNNLPALRGDRWVLDAHQLLLARQMGIIDKLPDLSIDDIDDRDKSGVFTKLVALGQTIWFMIEITTRLCQRLPTSQLETVTFAFAICSGITYILLMEKPKGVEYSIQIPAARYATATEMSRIALNGPRMVGPGRTSFSQALWIPNNSVHFSDRRQRPETSFGAGAAASLLLFGLAHCIAWNFAFPTVYEKVLWQASSIVTGVACLVASFFFAANKSFWRSSLGQRLPTGTNVKISNVIEQWIHRIVGSAFICARLFTIVEALRSLAFLPPEAFSSTNWTEAIPHFS